MTDEERFCPWACPQLGGDAGGKRGSSLESEPCSSRPQPSPCPRSVVEAAKAHPTFGELFQFATPVLMWDQHFSPETWNRLKERHVPYGWQGLSHAGTAPTGPGWWHLGYGVARGDWGPQENGDRGLWSLPTPPPREQGGGDGFANATCSIL